MKKLIKSSESSGAYTISNVQDLIKGLKDEYNFTVYLNSKGAVVVDDEGLYCIGAYLEDVLKYLKDLYGDVEDLEGMDAIDALEQAGEEFTVSRPGADSPKLREKVRQMKEKYLR